MRSRLALLGGQALALGLLEAFLVVPASALFLSTYGAQRLPWAYIVVAIAGIVTSGLVSRASRSMSLGRLGEILVTAYMVLVALCWVAIRFFDAMEGTFVLVVLFPLSIPIGFVIVGSQAVRLYDVRELKAQFPRAVAGFPAGFALGGFLAGVLAGVFGNVADLLLVGIVCAAGMLGLIAYTAREFPAELLTRPEPPSDAPAPEDSATDGSRWASLRDSLVVGVLAYQLLSGSVTQLLDYMVWERASAAFPDPEPLARFQGFYGSILNVTSIVFVFGVASWLLRRFGVRVGLAGNPALIVVACVALVAIGHGPGIVGFGFLAAACVAQIADITTTDGLTRTSVAATYQALPPDRRLRTQAIAEGAGTPISIGLTGVLLLLAQALGLDVLAIAWLVLGLAVIWLVVASTTYRSYAHRLADVLRHRAWDPRALRVDGPATEAAVRRLLRSDDPQERLTGLEALGDSGSGAFDAELARALHDDDPRVRLVAVDRVGAEDLACRPTVRTALADLLDETPAGVRAAAALIGRHEDVAPRTRGVWSDAALGSDPTLAEAAVAGAANAPHPDHLPVLLEMAGRPDPPLALVEALAAHVPRLDATLSSLWDVGSDGSDEPGGREQRERGSDGSNGSNGSGGREQQERGSDGTGSAARRRAVVIRAVASSGRSPARTSLLAHLGDADLTRSDLRLIVDGLRPASWTRRPRTVPAATLSKRIEREAARVLAALRGLARLDGSLAGATETGPGSETGTGSETGPGTAPGGRAADVELALAIARDAFRDELLEAQRHVEILFGATAAPRGTAWFLQAMGGEDSALRATAIELTEATFGRRRGAVVVAALDPTLDDAARITALEAAGVGGAPDDDDGADWLCDVALDAAGWWDSPWLQASVLRALPYVSPGCARRVAEEVSRRPAVDPIVAETAAWAHG